MLVPAKVTTTHTDSGCWGDTSGWAGPSTGGVLFQVHIMYLVPLYAWVCVHIVFHTFHQCTYVPVMAVLQPNVVLRLMTVNQLLPPCSLVVKFELGLICLVPLSGYTT